MKTEANEVEELLIKLRETYKSLGVDDLERLILQDLSEIKVELRALLEELKQKD